MMGMLIQPHAGWAMDTHSELLVQASTFECCLHGLDPNFPYPTLDIQH